MISISDLHMRYRNADRHAVAGVSLRAPRGSLTAIVGPNGSGKSTIVRAILRTMPVERGVVTVDGAEISSLTRRSLARAVAVVSQREDVVFPYHVRDYVAMGRLPFVSPWRGRSADDERTVSEAMERAGVTRFGDRLTSQLSGGEWQRVRIARALAQRSDAIVLDEPTTFLDVAHEMAVFELVRRIADDGHAVLIVSHQINLVSRFANRMVLLHNGSLVADGSPDDVMRGELLEKVYEWPLVITRDPATGARSLIPLRVR
jgi:iron complex transport system ATP-binding protein